MRDVIIEGGAALLLGALFLALYLLGRNIGLGWATIAVVVLGALALAAAVREGRGTRSL